MSDSMPVPAEDAVGSETQAPDPVIEALIEAVDNGRTDEFGDIYVFSQARLDKLKAAANAAYLEMVAANKEAAEVVKAARILTQRAEENQRTFIFKSKTFVATVKAVGEEHIKTVF